MAQSIHLSFRWETTHRYYKVVIQQDLFDQWQFVRCWGERSSEQGDQTVELLDNYEAAEQRLRRIARERKRLGYVLTTSPILLEAYGLSDLMALEEEALL